jgi:hypothetical protein
MALVAIISVQQKQELVGKFYIPDTLFNPVQDINDNWVISQEEVTQNQNQEVAWVNSLTLSTFNPKPWIPPGQ